MGAFRIIALLCVVAQVHCTQPSAEAPGEYGGGHTGGHPGSGAVMRGTGALSGSGGDRIDLGIDPDVFGGGGTGSGGIATGTGDVTETGSGGDLGQDPPGTLCGEAYADLQRSAEHCGACDNPCGPRQLATGPRWPLFVAMNDTHVYWTTQGTEGQVLYVPLSGGEPVPIATDQQNLRGIALDDTHVYWTAGRKLRKATLQGDDVQEIAAFDTTPRELVVRADGIYLTAHDYNDSSDDYHDEIWHVGLDGSDPRVLVADSGGSSQGLRVHADRMYWANGLAADQRKVASIARSGGAMLDVLATGGYTSFGATTDDSYVYWTSFEGYVGSRVLRVPLSGGSAEEVGFVELLQGRDVVVTNHYAYWTSLSTGSVYGGPVRNDGKVMRAPLSGGAATTIATGQWDPDRMATNGHTVCWAEHLGPSIRCLGQCVAGVCQ